MAKEGGGTYGLSDLLREVIRVRGTKNVMIRIWTNGSDGAVLVTNADEEQQYLVVRNQDMESAVHQAVLALQPQLSTVPR